MTPTPPPSLLIKPTLGAVFLRMLRDSQPAQIIICAVLGAVVGGMTILLHDAVMYLHAAAFGFDPVLHLSAAAPLDPSRVVFIPAAGGLLLGALLYALKRLRPRDITDPIEANAMFGGRMSLEDSLRLLMATLLSNGAGGSIGMEAAYTQMGSCLMSLTGTKLRLRREDMRVFVAAGAAAAISAAFNAPMAGAFYGYELVLGVYRISALAQVTLAALSANIFLRFFSAGDPIFSLPQSTQVIQPQDFVMFGVLGVAAALTGMLTMQAVTGCEALFRRARLPEFLRPAIGGIILSLLAIKFPQVLGSGQGAIDLHLKGAAWLLPAVAALLLAKIAASAVSIGSGFRGGLFSAALFIGCLLGQTGALVADYAFPGAALQVENFMLVGIGAVAASIIGAPITMVLLVLEMTGNFAASSAVLIGALLAATITRQIFGYSFSTWRFHLRGLRIRGAQDVGWVDEHKVRELMFQDTVVFDAATPVVSLRTKMAASAVRFAFLADNGKYAGEVDIAEAQSLAAEDPRLAAPALAMAKAKDYFLLPGQNIREALDVFAAALVEGLPVVQSANDRRIIGHVTETHLLKRYSQALEKRSAE